jgi:uncharacterized protein (TIGR02246 family)
LEEDEKAIREIITRIEQAWNAGDSARFAMPFAEDADYVVVNGMYLKGREAIDRAHRQIFDTFYKGSTNRFTLEHLRFLRPDVAVMHVHAHATFQDGVRESKARGTWIVTKEDDAWSIAAFHNTTITVPGA